MNVVILTGKAQRIKTITTERNAFVVFTLAESASFTDRNGEFKTINKYHDCICYDVNKMEGIMDGQPVYLKGSLGGRKLQNGDGSDVVRTYDGRNGPERSPVYTAQIRVDEVSPLTVSDGQDNSDLPW